MIQDHVSQQKHFTYIDSSEEEDNNQNFNCHLLKNTTSNLTNQYQCSSDLKQFQNVRPQHKPNKNTKHNATSRKLCKTNPDNFLLEDEYILQIQKIIKQNHQKLSKRTALLIPDTDKQILKNLQKRKKNYGFFLKALQVDRNYNNKLSRKVDKIKNQNQRKKTVHQSRKIQQNLQGEEGEMKKYVLDKMTKEQIVVDKIQKYAYRLGIERIRTEQKKIKCEVKQIEQSQSIKAVNLQVKQRNKIQELREQLQKMREINRVNKIDQKRVIKDMQKDVYNNKNLLLTKAETSLQGKFII